MPNVGAHAWHYKKSRIGVFTFIFAYSNNSMQTLGKNREKTSKIVVNKRFRQIVHINAT